MSKKNNRITIAKREEKELKDGYYVKLGIGMPTMEDNHISEYKKDNNHITNAKSVEKELKDCYYVNLCIGMPTIVANHISENKQVILQSENGLLGIGPYPAEDDVDPDLINAGKETVTAIKGASFFDN